MELKSIGIGVFGTLIALITIGVGLAAVASAGTTVTVPTGKTMMYHIMDNADAIELRDALCDNYKYDENSGETCTAFAQKKIRDFLIENVQKYRKTQHEQAFIEQQPIEIE